MYSSSGNMYWCIDSSATSHLCNNRDKFSNFEPKQAELSLATDKNTKILGTGNVLVNVSTGKRQWDINFKNVSYVPDLKTNLFSVARATDFGHTVTFKKTEAVVVNKNNDVIMRAKRRGNLYFVNDIKDSVNSVNSAVSSGKQGINKWHKKLGHVNERDQKLMSKSELVYGLDISDSEKLSECEVCIQEKHTRLPLPKISEQRTQKLLEIVHSDVCRPMLHASASGKRYFVTFIDDKSRWCQIYLMKNKSEVLEKFKEYKNEVENQTGEKIKALQSDNEKEYYNEAFNEFLLKKGIQR